jgi:hypothetical protein
VDGVVWVEGLLLEPLELLDEPPMFGQFALLPLWRPGRAGVAGAVELSGAVELLSVGAELLESVAAELLLSVDGVWAAAIDAPPNPRKPARAAAAMRRLMLSSMFITSFRWDAAIERVGSERGP